MHLQKAFYGAIILFFALSTAFGLFLTITVDQDSDDGTEVNHLYWHEQGYDSSNNYLGKRSVEEYGVGLRFHVPDLNQGDDIAYARLRLPSFGSVITSSANLVIEGVLQQSPTTFSQQERPSQKTPKTRTKIKWAITKNWDKGKKDVPLYYSSPDIAPLINEILDLPGWGTGSEGKKIALTISDDSHSFEDNYVVFDDYHSNKPHTTPALLEACKTVYDTFQGRELLGKVTDTSVDVNLYPLIATDVYIEYGTSPGLYDARTILYSNQPPVHAFAIRISPLKSDTRYYYRLRYRRTGNLYYQAGEEHTFHTQRSEGETFVFAVQADEHIQKMHKYPQKTDNMKLYEQTLQNIADGHPDFLLSVGDFADTEFYQGFNAKNLQDAKERYLMQRAYVDQIGHSIPFYLTLGNHEGEQGWYYFDKSKEDEFENLALISTWARKEIFPNPRPDWFYTGNHDYMPDIGFREDYYAWEWGDGLFVVLSPYWYTVKRPEKYEDAWLWTLGKSQYDWLYETLHHSDAKWKFIFIHHLTSSTVQKAWPYFHPYYGRGGIEIAKYKVRGWPSFEWGGEDKDGNYVFDQKRPGWTHGAVHDLLMNEKATVVFHGHDHFFAKQDLDGIVYLECPQPGNASYNFGFIESSGYIYGDFHPNSGHIQVTVHPDYVKIEYVRAYLPGDGNNGEIAYSCIIN